MDPLPVTGPASISVLFWPCILSDFGHRRPEVHEHELRVSLLPFLTSIFTTELRPL